MWGCWSGTPGLDRVPPVPGQRPWAASSSSGQPWWLHCTALCSKMDGTDDSSGSGQCLPLTIYLNQVVESTPRVQLLQKLDADEHGARGLEGGFS